MAAGLKINSREVKAILPEIYLTIPSYALFATIGLCFAVVYIFANSEKVNLSFGWLIVYIVVCTVCALILARIVFVIAMIPSLNPVNIDDLLYYLLYGGIVFYGGLFGVLLGIFIVSKYRRYSVKEMLDFAAPAFPLFHCWARIGCLFAGCCYGVEWSWGVILQGENVIRFPVQAVESICDLLIFIVIIYVRKKLKTDRLGIDIYLITYAICRFILEFFRGDEVRGIWLGGFSTAQYISITVLAVYIFLFIFRQSTNKKIMTNRGGGN